MEENFKITAKELKRQLKISVLLPKNYNANTENCTLVYLLDGQYAFSNEEEKEKMDLSSIEHTNTIIVGVHSPKNNDWRISEFCAFYNKEFNSIVDTSLSSNFSNYLEEVLHPIIVQRYRINPERIFLLGFKEGAIGAIYTLCHHTIFKGVGIFSPTIKCLTKDFFQDVIKSKRNTDYIYMYQGGKSIENAESNHFYHLFSIYDSMKYDHLKLVYENEMDNQGSDWQKILPDFIQYINH